MPPTIGKEVNRQRELEFFKSITEFRGASVLDLATGEDTTMVIWHYDYTHKDWAFGITSRFLLKNGRREKLYRSSFIAVIDGGEIARKV